MGLRNVLLELFGMAENERRRTEAEELRAAIDAGTAVALHATEYHRACGKLRSWAKN